jgi:hypothetical protein
MNIILQTNNLVEKEVVDHLVRSKVENYTYLEKTERG